MRRCLDTVFQNHTKHFNPIQTGGGGGGGGGEAESARADFERLKLFQDSTKRCQTLRVFLKFIWE